MHERVVTESLLARSVDYGDADRVCTLLTRRWGRVSALARGARRSRKRFGAALELFVVGNATLQSRARSELLLLERFDAVEDLGPGIGGDVVKVAHGSYMLEATRELWPPEQRDAALFDLLVAALRALARHAASPCLLRAFELRLLRAAGLAPALEHCTACGGPATGDRLSFSVMQGGVICAHCGPHGWPLAPAVREQLLALDQMPFEQAARATADVSAARAMRELTTLVLRHHLGKELRSLQFIAQLKG